MPAPQALTIEAALTVGLLAQGFIKQSYGPTGALIPIPGVLPDEMQKIVKGLAQGHATWFAVWQAAQPVSIPITSAPGSPSVGILP